MTDEELIYRDKKVKTITICGSMRFEDEMKAIAFSLEVYYGYNVLQCIYNPEKVELTDSLLQNLVIAHYEKIRLSDAIYVIDIDGYIGKSVKEEIAYAESIGKEIFYHSDFQNKKREGDI